MINFDENKYDLLYSSSLSDRQNNRQIFSTNKQTEIGELFELSSTSWLEMLFELVSTSTQIFSGLVGLVLCSTETGSKLVEKKLLIQRNIIWD